MDLELTGRRALVTGSTSGIGAGIARRLAAEGAIVVVHGRNRARGESVVTGITSTGGTASLVLGDLSVDDEADRVGREVMAALGAIDILVNNAAYTGGGPPEWDGHQEWLEDPIPHWIAAYQSKALAAVRMIKRFVPGMIERRWGRVINIGSAAAVQPVAGIPAQQAGYAAVLNMTASLARSLHCVGVTANTVSPGVILTPAVERWATDLGQQQGWPTEWDEIEKRLVSTYLPLPVGRIGRPDDIAAAVAYLVSPLSGFVTGINLRVDGGQIQSV
jgi:NAD(P)-dependent dehydrogenase (short-subunit alcohol dehydrogenase family)